MPSCVSNALFQLYYYYSLSSLVAKMNSTGAHLCVINPYVNRIGTGCCCLE